MLDLDKIILYRSMYKTSSMYIALVPPHDDGKLDSAMGRYLRDGEAYKVVGANNENVYKDAMGCVLEDVAAAGGIAAADARFNDKLRVRFSKDDEKELLVRVVYIHPKEQVLN